MRQSTTRRTKTTRHDRPTESVRQIINAGAGYTLRFIDGVEAACRVDGESIVQAIIDLPGSERLGLVQRAQADGTRWMASDSDGGWLDVEFATIQAAVTALRDPTTRQQMREYTTMVHQLSALTLKVLDFPQPDGALPSVWPPR